MATAFFPPARELPRQPRRFGRGFCLVVLLCGLGLGGIGLGQSGGHQAAWQRPGPRRYPPAYHHHEAAPNILTVSH